MTRALPPASGYHYRHRRVHDQVWTTVDDRTGQVTAKIGRPRTGKGERGIRPRSRNCAQWTCSAPTEREALLLLLEKAEYVLSVAEVVAISDAAHELARRPDPPKTAAERREQWLYADLGTRGTMPRVARTKWTDSLTGKQVHVYLEDGRPPRAHMDKNCKCRFCAAWRRTK